jgi:VanZ family protein
MPPLPGILPGFGDDEAPDPDKAAHVVVFFVLAALAVAPARARLRRPVVAAALASVAYGAMLELVQTAIPWRSGELGDLLADGVGSTLGAMTSLLRRRS